MRDDKPFPSAKAAVAAVARQSQPLDYPRSLIERAPGQPANHWAVADARTVLVNDLGLDLESEDFELLARWATVSDKPKRQDKDGRDEEDSFELPKSTGAALLEVVARHRNMTAKELLALCDGLVTLDELAEAAKGARQAEQLERLVGPRLDKLRALKRKATEVLRARGLIPDRAINLMPVGYRVHQYPDGHRHAVMVTEWDQDDQSVVTGPDAHLVADAIVAGRRAGPVVEAVVLTPSKALHPRARNTLLPRWQRGDFDDLVAFDRAIAELVGVGERQARKVRRSWGVESTPGCKPTRPPLDTVESELHTPK